MSRMIWTLTYIESVSSSPFLSHSILCYSIIFSPALSTIIRYSILKRIAYTGQASLDEDKSMNATGS